MAEVTANSSTGECIFDSETGMVINNTTDYPIQRFDVEEWHRAYPGEKLSEMECIDILDLGYHMIDGSYEGPEEDWREEFRAARAADEA